MAESLIDLIAENIADRISDRIGVSLFEVLQARERENRQLLNRIERLLRELDSKITQNQGELMVKFSEYKAAVDSTLLAVMEGINAEGAELAALLEDLDIPQSALDDLAASRQATIDALAGIVTVTPSPVVPTPISTPSEGEIPPLVIPEPFPTPAPPLVDPEVPVVIEPSPVDVGVDGGFSVEPTPL